MDGSRRLIASAGLVVGAVLGVAGTFAPPEWRPLAWGIDGTALVVAGALLTVHHLRRGNDLAAAGFLVFVAGQALILSVAAMDLGDGVAVFAAGVALWAASLSLVSASGVMPTWLRVTGLIAALLFAAAAAQVFLGHALSPLSRPLPFFAYPFFALTLCGWAWVHFREAA